MGNLGEIIKDAFVNRRDRMPADIAYRYHEVKNMYMDYKQNPQHYVDFNNLIDECGDMVTFRRKKFEDVANIQFLGAGAYSKADKL